MSELIDDTHLEALAELLTFTNEEESDDEQDFDDNLPPEPHAVGYYFSYDDVKDIIDMLVSSHLAPQHIEDVLFLTRATPVELEARGLNREQILDDMDDRENPYFDLIYKFDDKFGHMCWTIFEDTVVESEEPTYWFFIGLNVDEVDSENIENYPRLFGGAARAVVINGIFDQ
jgi:hypothetical protein